MPVLVGCAFPLESEFLPPIGEVMKKLFVSFTLAVLFLFCSSAHAADKVVVIPLNRSSSVNAGLNFNITTGGSIFTSQSKGWQYAGSDRFYISFFTDKGYYFQFNWSLEYTGMYVAGVVYESTDCSGDGYTNTYDNPAFYVFANGNSIFYRKASDSEAGAITYQSFRNPQTGTCYAGNGTTEPFARRVYPNDVNVTGVDFADPTNIKVVPNVE